MGLARRLARREGEGIRVVPIILRPCGWKNEPPIPALQARPTDGKANVTFSEGDGARDQAWLDIVDEIAGWPHGVSGTASPVASAPDIRLNGGTANPSSEPPAPRN